MPLAALQALDHDGGDEHGECVVEKSVDDEMRENCNKDK